MVTNDPIYQKKYRRKHYLKNRKKYIEKTRLYEAAIAAVVREAKNRPCHDCGISYPSWVMQFDHVRGKKVGNVSKMIKFGNLKKILKEIAKCEVVCANCHAERTHNRLA